MNNKQIGINLITNFMALFLSMGINFLMTPFLIEELGLEAYGYISIITNLISFFTVITYVLNSMVGRFYTIEFKKNNYLEANKYINTAFFTCILLGISLCPVIFYMIKYLDKLIVVDYSLLADVKFAFLLSAIAFIMSTLLSVINTGAYSSNRLDISNGIKIGGSLLRIIILLILIRYFNAKIWFVSFSSVIETLVAILVGYKFFRYLVPTFKISYKFFDKNKVKILLFNGFFNSIIIMGTLLMSQVSLLVANRYLDSMIVGIYSSILLIPNTLKSIATSFSSAFSPTTLEIYSKRGIEAMRDYSNNVIRFCGYALGWPISIAAALGIQVFEIWLDKDYSDYRFFFIFIMLHLVANLSVSQLNVVQQAVNQLKIPAIASIVTGVLNLILAIYLTGYLKLGLWGIGISSMISFTLRNSIFMPIYTAIITEQKWYIYFKGLLTPQLISIIVCFIGCYIDMSGYITNFYSFILVCIMLSIIYGGLVFLFLTKKEKAYFYNNSLQLLKN